MKRALFRALAALLLAPGSAQAAGGYTEAAIPTRVEIVQNAGFMIAGAFGNPSATPCGTGNYIWIAASHPQYDRLLALAMTAFTSRTKLVAYVHQCSVVPWLSASTFNELTVSGSMSLSN